jgi:hypothetical protein
MIHVGFLGARGSRKFSLTGSVSSGGQGVKEIAKPELQRVISKLQGFQHL